MVSSILMVDTDPFSRALAADLRALGCAVAQVASFAEALAQIPRLRPDRAIVELAVGGESALDFLSSLRGAAGAPRVLVVTAFAHVASAVAAMRLGAVDFLCKPLPASAVLGAFEGRPDERPRPLDAAIGVHLRYSVEASGSISGAARNLRVDRRSLRRMLARYCPGGDKQ